MDVGDRRTRDWQRAYRAARALRDKVKHAEHELRRWVFRPVTLGRRAGGAAMKRLKYSAAILDAIDEIRQLPVEEGARPWTACLKSRSGQVVGHVRLPSYAHVSALNRRLQLLGYEMSILHPNDTACDFVFAERGDSGSRDD